ncbi:hypothetical protein LMG31506_03010 [Cupriavidus yeoncheonensis]|uniref:Uncharacterized protein n=2 Tax=Cupriavidus yeoncheonensis TaxID=1462994 RepID=A0A916IVK8_9BURK|nr:hypothetical protein LMG31506_03010 [Cupriavidus yeoncheonensis]
MNGIFPAKISAGLTFSRLVRLDDYPAPVWALSAMFRGPSTINVSSAAEGDQHRLRAEATATTLWTPGVYAYSVRATNGADVVEVESGTITIAPDMANTADGTDPRSHARRALDAIEAVIEKRASMDQERYKINNRELWRTPVSELLKLRDTYRAEVRREEAATRGRSLFGAAVRVRF